MPAPSPILSGGQGLTLNEGLSLEFLAQQLGISVLEPDWQNLITDVSDYFVDLADLSEEISAEFAAGIIVSAEDLAPLLTADPDLLHSALDNLFDGAEEVLVTTDVEAWLEPLTLFDADGELSIADEALDVSVWIVGATSATTSSHLSVLKISLWV